MLFLPGDQHCWRIAIAKPHDERNRLLTTGWNWNRDHAMNRAITVFLALFASLPAIGQTPRRDLPQVEIESVSPIPDGFDVSFIVRNNGTPVFLPRAEVRAVVIRFVEIQQWDEKLGWQFVGPCSDVAGAIRKNPEQHPHYKQRLERVPLPEQNSALGGKIRAILLRAYESDEQFKALNPKGRVYIVSQSVEVPTSE